MTQPANIFELTCGDTSRWAVHAGFGTCPDCASSVLEYRIQQHVRWHQTLVCQVLAVSEHDSKFLEFYREFDPQEPGDCVRLAYELQLKRLNTPSG